ncbi:MAG: Uma2 family endonuclease [Anaerolineae bacterium]|jgi:Uma2 family endonuclease|nr:Uma2 family endonuclease [Anaerolineae bacterium]
MALQRPAVYTIEEFEHFAGQPENADRRFELIDGEIVEKMPTEEHGVIAALIVARIVIFLEQHAIGGRAAVEPRHRMPEDRHNSRVPDIAFTSAERLLPLTRKGAVPQMPDLAVEIRSPDDPVSLLRAKASYYLANGSRMVWLIFPEQRLVEVYRPDEDVLLLVDHATRHDVLDGAAVLPGFSLALNDIFLA